MVTTTSLNSGESLTIGLYFNDNYQLPNTCNIIVYIGGVCIGNLFTQQPEISMVGAYYTMRLSSSDTSKMRGYRDLTVVLDDPSIFGSKKFIVGGILFDRTSDEFVSNSENHGFNMIIGMTVNNSAISGSVDLIEAIKGNKGDKGDKGEDAVLPDGIVVDLDYVHTDNNYTDNEKSVVSNTSGINTGDQDLSNLLSLQHLSDFDHADIVHQNRMALDYVSGINTGDQDLSGLATKLEVIGGLSLKVDKEAGKGLSTTDYTAQEKLKLAGIEENANNYTHPETHPSSIITQDANNRFVTDAEKTTWNAKASTDVATTSVAGLMSSSDKTKLDGIATGANNYTHPDTHPSSILDVVDVVNGAANKFLNERGEMVAVDTSSIGVTGSHLYASTANSDVAGYKSLVGTPQDLETEILLTAKSTNGIVWGDKYLSAPFTEAVTIPTTAYGFDYWRKVSAANGTSHKHLRVFLYRAGVETNISTPLASPDINDTEFTERQISYIFPELALLAGDRIGIQEGFSTTHANNVTLTYIVGDGRGWFMRLPLPLKHENLTDKNSEAAFQHVDTATTKPTLDAADMVAIKDSVTGKVVLTPKENFGGDNLIASYTHTGNKEVTVTAVDLATGLFTASGHGLINGDMIFPILNLGYLESTFGIIRPFPTGLLLQRYFVVEATVDTFKVSVTSGGAAVTFTANANMDLTAWHFEKKVTAQVIISNITERNTRIVFTGWNLYAFLTITPSIAESGAFGSKNTFMGSGTTVVGNGAGILTYEGYVHIVRDTITDKRISSQFSGVIVKPGTVSANTIAALDAKVVSLYYSDVTPTNVIVGSNASSNIMVNGNEIKIYKL